MSLINRYLATTVFRDSTVGFFVAGDRVLLGIRKEVSDGLGHGLISGIGGKVEEGESEEAAIVRECEEEVGLIPTQFKKVGRVKFIFPHKPKWCHSVAIFLIDKWKGELKESIEMKPLWFPITEIPLSKMWEDNALWVPLILNGENYEGVILYGEDGMIVEELRTEKKGSIDL